MTRTNTIGETISAHDGHEDLPRDPTAEDAQEVAVVRAPVAVATSDAERAAPMDMLLCEFGRLLPRPDVTYRPMYMPGCAECDRLAALQKEAYGQRAPTHEEAEAAARPAAALPIDFKQATDQGGWPLIARALAEWNEDDGPVTWWAWCGHDWAGEPAFCGTPNDSDWPGYHTHWTAHPAAPTLLGVADGDAVGGKSGGA